MDDKSGDDDTGEVRWSWRRDESGRGRSDMWLTKWVRKLILEVRRCVAKRTSC